MSEDYRAKVYVFDNISLSSQLKLSLCNQGTQSFITLNISSAREPKEEKHDANITQLNPQRLIAAQAFSVLRQMYSCV